MKNKNLNLLSLSILFFLGSCSGFRNQNTYSPNLYSSPSYASQPSRPTTEELKNLKYPKTPKNFEKVFKDTISNELKDPDSAKYKNIKAPIKFWGKNSDLNGMIIICGTVNAKNAMGGYTGYETMVAAISEDSGEWYVLPLDNGANRFAYSSSLYPCIK